MESPFNKAVLRLLIFPFGMAYHILIQRVWLSLGIAFLVGIAVLSTPPVVALVTPNGTLSWLHALLLSNKGWLSSWCPSLRLIFEMLAAICVGGSVFAKSAAVSLETILGNLKARLDEDEKAKMILRESQIQQMFQQLEELKGKEVSWRELPSFALSLARLHLRLYNLAAEMVSLPYIGFWTTVLFFNFPGGLYGWLAFVCLALVCTIKLVQIYLTVIG